MVILSEKNNMFILQYIDRCKQEENTKFSMISQLFSIKIIFVKNLKIKISNNAICCCERDNHAETKTSVTSQ